MNLAWFLKIGRSRVWVQRICTRGYLHETLYTPPLVISRYEDSISSQNKTAISWLWQKGGASSIQACALKGLCPHQPPSQGQQDKFVYRSYFNYVRLYFDLFTSAFRNLGYKDPRQKFMKIKTYTLFISHSHILASK